MNECDNESRLVYQIMHELGKYGAVFRCNSGGVRLPSGKYFYAMPAGFADVMFVMPGGKVAFIEAKAQGGRLSPKQEAFIKKMQLLGCCAGVAHNVDEALFICGLGISQEVS